MKKTLIILSILIISTYSRLHFPKKGDNIKELFRDSEERFVGAREGAGIQTSCQTGMSGKREFYSGYMNVGTKEKPSESALFYLFYPSRDGNKESPVTMWL